MGWLDDILDQLHTFTGGRVPSSGRSATPPGMVGPGPTDPNDNSVLGPTARLLGLSKPMDPNKQAPNAKAANPFPPTADTLKLDPLQIMLHGTSSDPRDGRRPGVLGKYTLGEKGEAANEGFRQAAAATLRQRLAHDAMDGLQMGGKLPPVPLDPGLTMLLGQMAGRRESGFMPGKYGMGGMSGPDAPKVPSTGKQIGISFPGEPGFDGRPQGSETPAPLGNGGPLVTLAKPAPTIRIPDNPLAKPPTLNDIVPPIRSTPISGPDPVTPDTPSRIGLLQNKPAPAPTAAKPSWNQWDSSQPDNGRLNPAGSVNPLPGWTGSTDRGDGGEGGEGGSLHDILSMAQQLLEANPAQAPDLARQLIRQEIASDFAKHEGYQSRPGPSAQLPAGALEGVRQAEQEYQKALSSPRSMNRVGLRRSRVQ